MAEKNRQHYVPKFYLRNFSETERAIDTYNLEYSKYISNSSIRNMCQKHNFYGSDNNLEIFLDREIEAKASVIIKYILNNHQLPDIDKEDYIHLIMFLLITEARNLKNGDSIIKMSDHIIKALMKEHPGFKKVNLNSFKVEIKNPVNHSIQHAIETTTLVLDLKPILIVEQTGARGFITSDNPIVRYNSFYLKKGYPGGFGYMTRGMLIFFPISPKKCILLYDSLAYDVPNEKNGTLILKKAKDVDRLNELFFLNAYNNVFFNQKIKRGYIEGIHKSNQKTPLIKELDRELASFKSADSDGVLISYSQNRVAKNINFSWIKISDYANSLSIPIHMGGINRTESPYIAQYLAEQQLKYARKPQSTKKFLKLDE
ncbi:DUF4238 domain-containing protein [Bacillus sp. FJAT-42376]|nr:DUF4238 domain-containing protein [Bacillus sp. FJAT-42376]